MSFLYTFSMRETHCDYFASKNVEIEASVVRSLAPLVKHILHRVIRYCGIPEELVTLIEDLYSKSMSALRIDVELTEWFRIRVRVRQRCGMSPGLFNLILEIVMRLAEKEGSDTGVKLNGRPMDNLRFADVIDVYWRTQRRTCRI